ncbi:protein ApaG [Methyloglobulus morosus KoM1]|uniref:Protein ApaG n=1 Tax=Methyloglobulus morosus KoM1 TaxID=1116472 RepID=V5C0F1_9GAMM|nr:Co2+/Mg2+ efflux protein ApaG [Methyloglobulus morosus]ESS73534.1 protein ApaG [Methyloglobulus morosus KoM1]
METKFHFVDIDVKTTYLAQDSQPGQAQYVFSYTVTIKNSGAVAAQLLRRHWIITDANGIKIEVIGEGVVGEQPYLRPGEKFQYTSMTSIRTPVGVMHGSYQLIGDDGVMFDAPIPAFRLATLRQVFH